MPTTHWVGLHPWSRSGSRAGIGFIRKWKLINLDGSVVGLDYEGDPMRWFLLAWVAGNRCHVCGVVYLLQPREFWHRP